MKRCKYRNLNYLKVTTSLPGFSLEIEVSNAFQLNDFELFCGGLKRALPFGASYAIIDERSKDAQIKCVAFNPNCTKDYPDSWYNSFILFGDQTAEPSPQGAPSDAFSIRLNQPCTFPFNGWYGLPDPDNPGYATAYFFETYPNNPSRLKAFKPSGQYVGDGSFTFEYS